MNTVESGQTPPLLIVDDSDDDIFLLMWGLKKGGGIPSHQIARHGKEAVDYLKSCLERKKTPALVLLDLNMPMFNGYEVLEWIRAQPSLRELQVYILSNSSLGVDSSRAMAAGANGYWIKPALPAEYLELARNIHDRLPAPPLLDRSRLHPL